MAKQSNCYVKSFEELVEGYKEYRVLQNEDILPGFLMCLVEDFHDDYVNKQNVADESVAYCLETDVRSELVDILRERGVLTATLDEALTAVEEVLITSGLMQKVEVVKQNYFIGKKMKAWALPNPSAGFPADFDPAAVGMVLELTTFQGVLDAIKDMSSYFGNEERVKEFVSNNRVWTFLEYIVLKNYLGKNEMPMWSYVDDDRLIWERVNSWIMYHQLIQNQLGWMPSEVPALITQRWQRLVKEMIEAGIFKDIRDPITNQSQLILGDNFYYRLSSLKAEIKEHGILGDDLDDREDKDDPDPEE